MENLYQNLIQDSEGKGYVKIHIKDAAMLAELQKLKEENKITFGSDPILNENIYVFIYYENIEA